MNKTLRFSLLTMLVMLFCGIANADNIKATLSGTSMVSSGVSSTSYADYLDEGKGLTDDQGNIYYGRWCHQKNGSDYLNMIQIKKAESSTATRINLPKFPGNIQKITLTTTDANAKASTGDGVNGSKTRLAIVNSTTYNLSTANTAANQVLVQGSKDEAFKSYVYDFTALSDTYDGEGLYICSLDASARIWAIEVEYTAPAPAADTWTVAGEEVLTGSNWSVTNTAFDMAQIENTTLWTLTKSLTLTAPTGDDKRMWFKVAKNHSWDTSYGKNGENQQVTIPTDGTYDITFWYNTNGNAVFATYAHSIIGNIWDNWATDKDMTQDPTTPYIYK